MNITLPTIVLLLSILPGVAADRPKAYKTINIPKSVPDPFSWRPSFSSLDNFVKVVEPPNSSLLASRDTGTHFIALFRKGGDKLIVAKTEIASHYTNESYSVRTQNGVEAADSTSSIPLVDFVVSKANTTGPMLAMSATYCVYGHVFYIKPEITGDLVLEYETWNEGSGLPRIRTLVPFIWTEKKP